MLSDVKAYCLCIVSHILDMEWFFREELGLFFNRSCLWGHHKIVNQRKTGIIKINIAGVFENDIGIPIKKSKVPFWKDLRLTLVTFLKDSITCTCDKHIIDIVRKPLISRNYSKIVGFIGSRCYIFFVYKLNIMIIDPTPKLNLMVTRVYVDPVHIFIATIIVTTENEGSSTTSFLEGHICWIDKILALGLRIKERVSLVFSFWMNTVSLHFPVTILVCGHPF